MYLLCVPFTLALFPGHIVLHLLQYFWIQGRGEGPKQLLHQCRRRRRCHLVCLFPDSFLRNVERRGGDVPTQAARRAQGVKVCFPGMSKIGFGTLDLILRFLSTTLVRELRFSGQRTPPLFWRSAMLLSVVSTRTKHLVACACLVFSFWSS